MITEEKLYGHYVLKNASDVFRDAFEDSAEEVCAYSKEWALYKENRLIANTRAPCAIPPCWTGLKLVQIRAYNHNTSIFTFALSNPRRKLSLPPGAFLFVRAPGREHGGGDAIRPYTAVSDPAVRGSFDLLIKRYDAWGERRDSTTKPKPAFSVASLGLTGARGASRDGAVGAVSSSGHAENPYRPPGAVSTYIHGLQVGEMLDFKYTTACHSKFSTNLLIGKQKQEAAQDIAGTRTGTGAGAGVRVGVKDIGSSMFGREEEKENCKEEKTLFFYPSPPPGKSPSVGTSTAADMISSGKGGGAASGSPFRRRSGATAVAAASQSSPQVLAASPILAAADSPKTGARVGAGAVAVAVAGAEDDCEEGDPDLLVDSMTFIAVGVGVAPMIQVLRTALYGLGEGDECGDDSHQVDAYGDAAREELGSVAAEAMPHMSDGKAIRSGSNNNSSSGSGRDRDRDKDKDTERERDRGRNRERSSGSSKPDSKATATYTYTSTAGGPSLTFSSPSSSSAPRGEGRSSEPASSTHWNSSKGCHWTTSPTQSPMAPLMSPAPAPIPVPEPAPAAATPPPPASSSGTSSREHSLTPPGRNRSRSGSLSRFSSHIRMVTQNNKPTNKLNKLVFLYGVRAVEEILCKDTLLQFEKDFPGRFRVVFCIGSRYENMHMGANTLPIPRQLTSSNSSRETIESSVFSLSPALASAMALADGKVTSSSSSGSGGDGGGGAAHKVTSSSDSGGDGGGGGAAHSSSAAEDKPVYKNDLYVPPALPKEYTTLDPSNREVGWVNFEHIQKHQAQSPLELDADAGASACSSSCSRGSNKQRTRVVVCGLPSVYEKLCGSRFSKDVPPHSVLGRLGYDGDNVIKL